MGTSKMLHGETRRRVSITKFFIQNNKKPRLAQTGFYKYMLLIIFWGQALV